MGDTSKINNLTHCVPYDKDYVYILKPFRFIIIEHEMMFWIVLFQNIMKKTLDQNALHAFMFSMLELGAK